MINVFNMKKEYNIFSLSSFLNILLYFVLLVQQTGTSIKNTRIKFITYIH